MADKKRQTLDQERASHAWALVEEAAGRPDDKKEFGTQVKKLPMRILAAGLGPALAFLKAKGYAETLCRGLSEWMHKRRPAAGAQNAGAPDLVDRIVHGDADFLRYATAECLAYLQWVVRFADAKGLTEDTEK